MIRNATLADVTAISDIRTRSWQHIYRGQMPDAFLDALDSRQSDERWRLMIDGTPRSRIFVGRDGGAVTGFIALEPVREINFGYEAYLSALYVEPELMGHGLGRALFDVSLEWMREAGYRNAFWWVNVSNSRAIAFYERMGAMRIPDSRRLFDAGGVSMNEHAYGVQL